MYRKINYFIITIICLLVCYNVKAIYSQEGKTDSELLARCQYKSKSNQKIILEIDKDYQVNLIYADNYEVQNVTGFSWTYKIIKNFSYDNFMNTENKLHCVPKLYTTLYTAVGTGNYDRSGTKSYVYDINKDSKNKPSGTASPTVEYNFDSTNSKVFENNQDKEAIEDKKWDRICHYGDYYLKFNKSTYETNITNLYKNYNDIMDVMSYLSSINYSCPTSLCSESRGSHGYSAIYHTFKMEYDKKCTISQDYVSKYTCGSLEAYMREYDNLKQSNEAANKVSLRSLTDKIEIFCNSILQSLDYEDPTKCVKECLEIGDIIVEDMNLDKNVNDCGFSERLGTWIVNIFKWIKYILPVLVIVLGILDFIKAISADKEDEMKKAQKNFIIRLIAAALVFIIPLILEFILIKMGFGYDSCSLF